jgi:hypothetical protein
MDPTMGRLPYLKVSKGSAKGAGTCPGKYAGFRSNPENNIGAIKTFLRKSTQDTRKTRTAQAGRQPTETTAPMYKTMEL